ncbi:MBL fold metallo-hydrolase [soil metagenome]
MNQFKSFTGGVLDTNCFFYKAPEGGLLFDAPPGADAAFAQEKIDILFLTHGHFDHTHDAAAIIQRHGCRVAFHPDTLPMVSDREFFRSWGFGLEIEPFAADLLLSEGEPQSFLGAEIRILEVPGHCPGSLCYLLRDENALVGGDVLMRGGVGRTNLPGGDGPLLFDGIRQKLMTLPDDVIVLPGHGPATTIGLERRENPYLAE